MQRTPPSGIRRIAYCAMVLMALSAMAPRLAICAPVRDPAGVKQEREDVRKQLHDLSKAITQTSSEKQRVSRALDLLDKKLEQTGTRLAKLVQDRKALENDIGELKQKETQLANKLSDTESRLGKVIRNQQRRVNINPTQAWLAGRSASQAAREGYWFERVSTAEQILAKQQTQQAQEMAAIRAGLEKKSEKLQTIITDQNKEERVLQSQHEERQQLVADLSSKLKDQEIEKERLQRDEKRLTSVIDQLSKAIELAKKKQALEKQKEATAPRDKTDTKKPVYSSTPIPDNGDFAKLKGSLQLPVAGNIVGEFGKTRAKDGQGPSWKGIFIETAANLPVKAVASGRVVFSEWLRGFGELVIIDHGDQYLSVYGNNGKVLKSAGDVVKAGETIAQTGNSSGNLETGLYFELRHQGQPFNPISWTKGQ